MAILLHRLGRWCARRPWAVIGVWVALFALTVSGMVAFAKPLSNEFNIPGSRFEQVLATLKTEVPEAGGRGGRKGAHGERAGEEGDGAGEHLEVGL